MLGFPLAFAYPLALGALIALPIIWYLLRLTPPKPQDEVFPPLVILERLVRKEDSPAKSPWWLTVLRLAMATMAILAMAGPVWNPRQAILDKQGPVLLVVDDGWASGEYWDAIKRTALEITEEAKAAGRSISLLKTSEPFEMPDGLQSPEEISARIEAASNLSIRPDHANSALRIRQAISRDAYGETVFLSDGLSHGDKGGELLAAMTATGLAPKVISPPLGHLLALAPLTNEPTRMTGSLARPMADNAIAATITGYDKDGLSIARSNVILREGETSAGFEFSEPVELRNQITRVAIDGSRQAGSVQLLDDSNRRRIVGLISGQSLDISQPLLSPLYYITNALAPFSDLRQGNTSNLGEAVDELIAQNVSAIVMADVGTIPPEETKRLAGFVEAGGMLIRFAGPRLAASPDSELLPVKLIQGDRFIGGALSWDKPKTVAPFEPGSPFFGLPAPKNVEVSRQVLALQSADLDKQTWARLEDGTPLVTAGQSGEGWIVLFHVNSDNNWSNLPLSGTFVEMLRRTVNLSRSNSAAVLGTGALRLPPMEILDGAGNLTPPLARIKPLILEKGKTPVVSLENPPGLYGTDDGYVALNLIGENEDLIPLNVAAQAPAATLSNYVGNNSFVFKPVLLAIAAVLLLLDCLAVLWFAGILRRRTDSPGRQNRFLRTAGIAIFLLGGSTGLIVCTQAPAHAQTAATVENPDLDFSATLRTRFAYVKTGIGDVDSISAAGLLGLTRYVSSRTALEPGDPIGIDVASDELSFYPFLYWPIDQDSPVPDAQTMARVDAYMKQGGTILFDTRDQISGSLISSGGSPEIIKLREILASLDIPPLEPVPADHVLTKSFFLLDSFPGRYQGGDLWVEQIGTAEEEQNRPARSGDGVSTIMITSNDFAGAWAIDENNRSLFATVPASNAQREYAFRVGVNIVMYTMTGNYKADQVHIPALLERLGQ
jgi:hypothetical protein